MGLAAFAYEQDGKDLKSSCLGDVGTTRGWGEFGRWVDTLPVEECLQLHYVRQEGDSDKLADLEKHLEYAIKRHPPRDAAVLKTARNFLDLVKRRPEGAEVILISDGTE